jgi:hypothetical protein
MLYSLECGLIDLEQFRESWKSMEGKKLGDILLDKNYLERMISAFKFQKYSQESVLRAVG